MKKTVGILAHVDSGKTTFCEQILYHTKSIRSLGRVDHKDSFLDSNNIERERGITIFSAQAKFQYKNSTYYLVDTPGHLDFSCEMERTLSVLDYAVIIVSASEGIQGHTKTIWNLLKKKNIPVFIFINKLDREETDVSKTIKDIKKNLCEDIYYLNNDNFDNNCEKIKFTDQLIEFICEYDEKIMESYLNGEDVSEQALNSLKHLIKKRKVFMCVGGSALNDNGIDRFLCAFDELTCTGYEEHENDDFSGIVYKITHDSNNTRITFVKLLNGTLKAKDTVSYLKNFSDEESENVIHEKVNNIKIYNGEKGSSANIVYSGDIAALTGITEAMPGNIIGKNMSKGTFSIFPALLSKVIFDNKINPKDILKVFKILESEEPQLNVEWNENTQEIVVNVMGKIQLEILKNIICERFNYNVDFGPCKILYKESIKDTVVGKGHFEPLRHYAEVHLKMEPLKRNSKIEFDSLCHVDTLSINYQKLIKTHVFERVHKGVLTGSPICDIKFTLIAGKSHLKHTCGGDFREATYRAIRQGLEKSESVLLEPYYKFTLIIPEQYIGRAMSDITMLSGSFSEPINEDDKVIINGRGPVATFMDYYLEVIAYTKGKGNISFVYDGYDECHNSEEVIEKIGYDKESDKDNISSSVFCSHGSGYSVPWNEADDKMHIKID